MQIQRAAFSCTQHWRVKHGNSSACASEEPESKDALKKCFEPVLALQSPGGPGAAFAERFHFSSMRWSVRGTKQVVMTCEQSFYKFVAAKTGSTPSFSELWFAFRDLNADDLKQYLSAEGAGKTYTATMSCGDCMVTPLAFIVVERTIDQNHVSARRLFVSKTSWKSVLISEDAN